MTAVPFTAERFSYWWTLFVERWRATNRPPAELAQEYARHFRRCAMTDLDLEVGASLALAHCDFLPSPQAIVDKARPAEALALKVAAADAWDDVRRIVASSGTDVHAKRERVASLGPRALAAYKIVGDYRRVRYMNDEDYPFVRREFVQAYLDAAEADRTDWDASRVLATGAPLRQLPAVPPQPKG